MKHTHNLGLLASRPVRNQFLFFISHPACGIFVTATQAEDYRKQVQPHLHFDINYVSAKTLFLFFFFKTLFLNKATFTDFR